MQLGMMLQCYSQISHDTEKHAKKYNYNIHKIIPRHADEKANNV